MSTSADFPSFQYSTTNYNKSSAQEAHDDQFFDKENCNVHQPKTSQRLPFQPKTINTNALSERMEELSYQSTIDCSVDFDQISRFSEDFALPSNFLEPSGPKVCLHMNTVTRRCSYCKDCGIFIPRNGSIVYRENMYADKLNICPDEIYETMLKNQTKNRSYDPNATHVQFRKTITDWIFQVSQDLKVSPDTTCAIISYIDTILCRVEVAKESLQLIILSCLILATKFSETDDKVPPLREAYNLCHGTYSIDAFKKAENFILEQLDWNLKIISPYQYIHHFLSKGCIFSSDKTAFSSVDADALKHLRRYAECFVNLSLDDYEFNQFTSHVVACAAIASSRKLIGVSPIWNSELEELTGTSWEIIEPCFNKLYSVFEAAFPELLGFQKLPTKTTATNEEIQNENQENLNCNVEASSESKTTPVKRVYTKVISKSTSSGKKKGGPANKKEIKRKNLSRFAKKSDTGNKQQQNKVDMNIETSDEFFDNGERNGSIKRNLIY